MNEGSNMSKDRFCEILSFLYVSVNARICSLHFDNILQKAGVCLRSRGLGAIFFADDEF
jgi:hypothetical protein